MKRPRNRRIAFVAALATALTFTAAATDAFARAGKNSSSSSSSIGSRGERTQSAPAPTQTAPNTVSPSQAAPTRPAQQPGMAQPAAAQSGGFFSRGGFGGMLMGGLIGAGIAGMLFGGGFLDGLGSLAGMLGFLLQVALIGFLVMLAVRFFKNRRAAQQGPQPAYAGSGLGQGMGGQGMGGPLNREQAPQSGAGLGGGLGGLMGGLGGGAQPAPAPTHTAPERTDEIGIVGSDYEAFERLLVEVQDAYSRGDRAALARLATAEVAGHFTAELDDAAARGVVNSVTAVKLEQGDLSEAWREADAEYATVAIRFSMVDVTIEKATGKVVDGDPAARVEATEIWTFRRANGGAWALSAIQQA